MAADLPPKRPAPKRAAPPVIPTSDFGKYLPYAALAVLAAALVYTVTKSERYAVLAAAALGVGLFGGLGYVGWQHTHSLAPGDSLRRGVLALTGLVVVAALAPYLYALFPPNLQRAGRLERVGDSARVEITGTAASVILVAAGDFKPDLGPSVRANYRLLVRKGSQEELVEGTFVRTSSSGTVRRGVRGGGSSSEARANRHVLQQLRGAGSYTVTLDQLSDTAQPPVLVDAGAEPFSPLVLGVLFGVLAVAVLAVDTLLYRKKVEPAYAAAMLVPLAAVFYFHGHMTHETLPDDLLAAGIVGALAGGLGGELLGRLIRLVTGP